MDKDYYVRMNELGAKYIRDYAYEHGKDISKFMDRYKIGKSEVGRLMDLKGKGQAAHRLYGHHIIYDFPIDNLEEIKDFVEHIFSDLFTKQGIPILPGEMLEDLGLIKYCKVLKENKNWNFVNGFDILTATISIYTGMKSLDKALNTNYSIDTFEDLAKNFGVGAVELAVAMSTFNPFLLIGAILQITSGVVGILNEGSRVYIQIANDKFTLDVKNNMLSLDEANRIHSLDHKNNEVFQFQDTNRFSSEEVLKKILSQAPKFN